MKIKAIYKNGILRPLEKVVLREKEEIEIKIADAVRNSMTEQQMTGILKGLKI